MGGFMKMFLRITPIFMLFCFICYGITALFHIENLTYLTEVQRNGTTFWAFDTRAYINNINLNIFERAFNQVIDFDAWRATFEVFEAIWADGYDLWDISRTIADGIVVILNTITTICNFSLFLIRISIGILLQGISLMGIRIDGDGAIMTTLNAIVDFAAIPMITPWTP